VDEGAAGGDVETSSVLCAHWPRDKTPQADPGHTPGMLRSPPPPASPPARLGLPLYSPGPFLACPQGPGRWLVTGETRRARGHGSRYVPLCIVLYMYVHGHTRVTIHAQQETRKGCSSSHTCAMQCRTCLLQSTACSPKRDIGISRRMQMRLAQNGRPGLPGRGVHLPFASYLPWASTPLVARADMIICYM
jgi:hypothetical protein